MVGLTSCQLNVVASGTQYKKWPDSNFGAPKWLASRATPLLTFLSNGIFSRQCIRIMHLLAFLDLCFKPKKLHRTAMELGSVAPHRRRFGTTLPPSFDHGTNALEEA
jgi:hypothetical protein